MEVVVTFEGGDPDKPLVLGAVYNATHPSPFVLPGEKTRSGFRTQSTPGGNGYNELSFEDALEREQVFLHAAKDHDEIVEHNHTSHVRNEEHITVGGNRTDAVGKNKEERTGADHTSIVEGSRVDVVKHDADLRVSGTSTTRLEGRERREVQGQADHVHAGDRTLRVLGSSTTIVGTNDKKRSWTTYAEGSAGLCGVDRLELSSETEIVLSVGESAIRITKAGIEISASSVKAAGEGASWSLAKNGMSMKSDGVRVSMSDRLVMSTDASSISVGKAVQVDGPKILLNSPDRVVDPPPQQPEPPTTIELRDQAGAAVAFQRFVVRLDDGAEVSGRTDKDGTARIEIPTGGRIVFSDLVMSDEPPRGDAQAHVIRQGEYLAKLALTHGFDPDEAWNHPKNAELKDKRKNPNVLYPGDVIFIPKGPRVGKVLEKGTTNQYDVHVPRTTVRLKFEDHRLFDANYEVRGLGAAISGRTDGAGATSLDVPVHVREVQLEFPEKHVSCNVRIGNLDPIDEPSGYRQRLEHLGYRKRAVVGETEEQVRLADERAVREVQREHGLEPTGVLDDATKHALERAHGS